MQTHALVLRTPEPVAFSVDTTKSEKLPKLEMAYPSSISDTVLFLGMPHRSKMSTRQKWVAAHHLTNINHVQLGEGNLKESHRHVADQRTPEDSGRLSESIQPTVTSSCQKPVKAIKISSTPAAWSIPGSHNRCSWHTCIAGGTAGLQEMSISA